MSRDEPARARTARRGYGLIAAASVVLMMAGLVAADSWEALIGYVLMTIACVAPVVFWMLAGAPGLPVFPMLSSLYYFYYALPILRSESGIAVYSPGEILDASVTVALFLGAGTVAWYGLVALPAVATCDGADPAVAAPAPEVEPDVVVTLRAWPGTA